MAAPNAKHAAPAVGHLGTVGIWAFEASQAVFAQSGIWDQSGSRVADASRVVFAQSGSWAQSGSRAFEVSPAVYLQSGILHSRAVGHSG